MTDPELNPTEFRWPDGLQPQELTITLLGAYVRPRPRPVWSGGLVRLLGEFGFSTAAARIALGRLVRRGLLAPTRSGRLVHYVVPERTDHLMAEGDRRIFSFGRTHPDQAEVWTLVWHSIPERQRLERARLGRRLRFLGFGPLQDGVWVSPHDREAEVTTLLRDLGVEERAAVILGFPAASLPFPKLILSAWDLDALARRYEGFIAEFEAYTVGEAVTDREAFLLRTRLVHLFRGFPFLDPELPADLIPGDGARTRAVSLFHELYEELAEPANRYFDAVTTPPAVAVAKPA
jgi:phenylacetic acid degradation operon negative regulatory protein